MAIPRIRISSLLLCAFLLPAARLSAQVVTGVVLADSTQPVAAAQVLVIQDDLLRRVATDQRGRFSAHVEPGTFRLHVSALGFDSIRSNERSRPGSG